MGAPNLRHALCKFIEFASPHFDFVIIVYDGVIGLKAAMVKILVSIHGIAEVGEVWRSQTGASSEANEGLSSHNRAADVLVPATPFPESCEVIWFHTVSGEHISGP